jgi:hypothetical protein
MAEILIDTIPLTFTLEESKDPSKKGKVIARGEFARSDKATENKRLYREHLWRREIGRLGEAMKERRTFGELDHPADGRTKLQRVSHLLTGLKVEGNSVIGETEILDTPNGRILKTIMEAGAKVGVSSRGFGSTKTNAEGMEEVQEDFRLDTFDFVADPATKTAYPQVFHEERLRIPEDDMGLTLEDLRTSYPGLVEEVTKQAVVGIEERVERRLKDQFAGELRRQLEQVTEAAEDRVRSEMLSDPEVAGAQQILERIASMVHSFASPVAHQQELDERDSEIKRLKDELADRELEIEAAKAEGTELGKLAKEASYRLHMERRLAGESAREAIIKIIGDVMQYESIEALGARIDAVAKELSSAKDEHVGEEDEAKEALAEKLRELETRLEKAEASAEDSAKQVAEANERTRKALDIAEAAQVEGFVEGIAASHPEGDRLRSLCEGVGSVEEARRIVAGYEAPKPRRTRDEDEAQRIRARVAKGQERSLEEDTFGGKGKNRGNGQSKDPLAEVGLDLTEDEFDELAGTKGLES